MTTYNVTYEALKLDTDAPSVGDVLADCVRAASLGDFDALQNFRRARAAFVAEVARSLAFLSAAGVSANGREAERILRQPDFDKAGPPGDWRTYVPQEVRGVWHVLPPDARAALYLTAARRVEEAPAGSDTLRAAVLAVLDSPRTEESCQCEKCLAAIAEAGQETCAACGYVGPFAALACDCEGVCIGEGAGRGIGCFHGITFCPVCDDGNADAFAMLREVRDALNPQAGEAPAQEGGA